jgi:hypothetical protein
MFTETHCGISGGTLAPKGRAPLAANPTWRSVDSGCRGVPLSCLRPQHR